MESLNQLDKLESNLRDETLVQEDSQGDHWNVAEQPGEMERMLIQGGKTGAGSPHDFSIHLSHHPVALPCENPTNKHSIM